MISNDTLGALAATLTTASFVPQAVLTLRTRDVSGISLGMYSVFTLGVALWLAYGWRIGAWPIIVANALTLALAAVILATKLWVDRQNRCASQSQGRSRSHAGAGAPGGPRTGTTRRRRR